MEGRSPKYIFVTGGVVSSLGKGLAAASVGCLLEAHRLRSGGAHVELKERNGGTEPQVHFRYRRSRFIAGQRPGRCFGRVPSRGSPLAIGRRPRRAEGAQWRDGAPSTFSLPAESFHRWAKAWPLLRSGAFSRLTACDRAAPTSS